MFCKKCGSKNLDDAAFCNNCGAPLQEQLQSTTKENVVQNSVKLKKKRLSVFLITAMIVLVAVVAAVFFRDSIYECVSSFFGDSGSEGIESESEEDTRYKSIIKQYFKAALEADGKALVELFPSKCIRYEYEDLAQSYTDDLQYYGFVLYHKLNDTNAASFSTKVINAEAHPFSDYKVLVDKYAGYGYEVDTAKMLTVQITVKSSEAEYTGTMDIGVVKIDETWYLDYFNPTNIADFYDS